MDNLNELTNVSRSGTLTVAGTATERRGSLIYGSPAGVTNVTVSGTGLSSGSAELYADGSWARTNASPATSGASTFTAIAQDTYGRSDTNSLSVTLPASVACQYDANGNLTNDGTRSFEYDAENQLTNVYAAGQWRSSFRYDAFLRLRVKQEYAWQSSAWVLTNEVRYVYDGMEVVQERDGNNTPQVSYTRGSDLSGSLAGAGGIGGLLARTEMGLLAVNDGHASALYHADGNGNITCLIQTNGTVVARYSYDPFGRLLTQNGSLADANVYRFSSKEWHANAGLYYYGYRFYSPELQRWLNSDPIGEEGGLNLYGYVHNSPLNFVDTLGLEKDAACANRCLQQLANCYSSANIIYAASGGLVGVATIITGGVAGAGDLQTPGGRLRPFTCRGSVTSFWRSVGRGLGTGLLAGSIYGLTKLHADCLGTYAGCLDACPEAKKPTCPPPSPPGPPNCSQNVPPMSITF